jgi:hypothetical protein
MADKQEPVAWAVMFPNGKGVDAAYEYEDDALMAASDDQEIVPLYRQPHPTLTDEEREAVEGAIKWYDNCRAAATLRSLLERLK